MKIEITEIRNAISLNEENTKFDLEINHPHFGWIPYFLDPNDTDQTIDNECLKLMVGDNFQEYIPPTHEEIMADLAQNIRDIRNDILSNNVDPIVSNPLRWEEMSQELQEQWKEYRQLLLDITDQEKFPNEVIWPEEPK